MNLTQHKMNYSFFFIIIALFGITLNGSAQIVTLSNEGIGSSKSNNKKEFSYPESELKSTYRIDVLLPLYLDELVKNDKAVHKTPPAHILPTINFYEGIKLAADSLNSLGFHFDIYIHDIFSEEGNINNLINSSALDSSDLVIGYLTSSEFQDITEFTKKHKINFLSALSPSDSGITNNPYFISLQPALNIHIEQLVAHALKKHPANDKYLIYLEDSPLQIDAKNMIMANLGMETYKALPINEWTEDDENLKSLFSKEEPNIIFMNVFDNRKVDAFLKQLQHLGKEYKFEIYGMPSWKTLPNLSRGKSYEHLSIYYTSPFFYDTQSAPGVAIKKKYQKEYGKNMSELVYRGFECLFWMAHLLENYGHTFNKNLNDISAAPFTRYKIKSKFSIENDLQSLGNEYLYIFHYQNGYFNLENH